MQDTSGPARSAVLEIGKNVGVTLDCFFEQVRDALLLYIDRPRSVYIPEVDVHQIRKMISGHEALFQHLCLQVDDTAHTDGEKAKSPAEVVAEWLDLLVSKLGTDIHLNMVGLDSLGEYMCQLASISLR